MDTLYFLVNAHGSMVWNRDKRELSEKVVPDNMEVMFPASCGNYLELKNLDPMIYYKSSYAPGSQFLSDLAHGILPVFSAKNKKRKSADYDISKYVMSVNKSNEIYYDAYIYFDHTYQSTNYSVYNYGGISKTGIFQLPLIDDTLENCEYNKREFLYRPHGCNCYDIKCEFDIDEVNNEETNGFRNPPFLSDNVNLENRDNIEKIKKWATSHSIFTDELLLKSGGIIYDTGYVRIKLSNIVDLLKSRYPGRKIIVICATCMAVSPYDNKFLNAVYNKSLHTTEYNNYVVDLMTILLKFFETVKIPFVFDNIHTQLSTYISNESGVTKKNILEGLELIDMADRLICEHKDKIDFKNTMLLIKHIEDFNEQLSAELSNDTHIVSKNPQKKKIPNKIKSKSNGFSLSCIKPAFGAPGPAFGAPSPAFGNPSPAFGAPGPAFGDPSPAFGAPGPAFGAPAPAFGAPSPAFGNPGPAFGNPSPAFGAPGPAFGAPGPAFGNPSPAFGAPGPAFGNPSPAFGAPGPAFGAPSPAFGAPSQDKPFGAPATAFGNPSQDKPFGAPATSFGSSAQDKPFGAPATSFGSSGQDKPFGAPVPVSKAEPSKQAAAVKSRH